MGVKIARLPLFVLGPDFFPGFTGTLRVFEPRYKQMMDDCILDSKPFGYISADPTKEKLNGWSQPAKYGTLCYVRDYEESGSNLIIEIEATSIIALDEVIQPVLPSFVDGERFPGVEELMKEAGNPENGKLYLMADVELLEPPQLDFDDPTFTTFTEMLLPIKDMLQMSSMYKGQSLTIEEHFDYFEDLEKIDFIWRVCCAICYDVQFQQRLFCQQSFDSVIKMCADKIRSLMNTYEEK